MATPIQRAPLNPNWNRLRPKLTLQQFVWMAGVFIGLVFGLCIGRTSAQPYEGQVATEAKLAPTVTVTVTKTVTKPVMPESCALAVANLADMQGDMEILMNSSRQQTDILNAVYLAIARKDLKSIVRLGDEQNQLMREVIGSRRDLLDMMARFTENMERCKTDLGR